VDPAAPDTEPSVAPTDPEQVRDLAEQLRSQGVVVVASRALAAARPEGIDLLGALPVLTREIAQEWLDAADGLPVLDVDRLQVRSASALLGQAAATAAADAIRVDALDGASVARAASLRSALRSPEEPNLLLDRTWAVLCDLRRLAANGSGAASEGPRTPSVVPSATVVSVEEAQGKGGGAVRGALHAALAHHLAQRGFQVVGADEGAQYRIKPSVLSIDVSEGAGSVVIAVKAAAVAVDEDGRMAAMIETGARLKASGTNLSGEAQDQLSARALDAAARTLSEDLAAQLK